jgi:hypothetical protein
LENGEFIEDVNELDDDESRRPPIKEFPGPELGPERKFMV